LTPSKQKSKPAHPHLQRLRVYGEEPVAFGLVALLVQFKFPEDQEGIVDEVEAKLGQFQA
jgi:translation elongation factor EF-1beta